MAAGWEGSHESCASLETLGVRRQAQCDAALESHSDKNTLEIPCLLIPSVTPASLNAADFNPNF